VGRIARAFGVGPSCLEFVGAVLTSKEVENKGKPDVRHGEEGDEKLRIPLPQHLPLLSFVFKGREVRAVDDIVFGFDDWKGNIEGRRRRGRKPS